MVLSSSNLRVKKLQEKKGTRLWFGPWTLGTHSRTHVFWCALRASCLPSLASSTCCEFCPSIWRNRATRSSFLPKPYPFGEWFVNFLKTLFTTLVLYFQEIRGWLHVVSRIDNGLSYLTGTLSIWKSYISTLMMKSKKSKCVCSWRLWLWFGKQCIIFEKRICLVVFSSNHICFVAFNRKHICLLVCNKLG